MDGVSQLLPQHRELLVARAISDAVAVARGYRSIGKAEAHAFGFTGTQARPGLLIPLWRVDGAQGSYQLHPDKPRLTKDGKVIKYEMPKGQRNVLDVPPTVRDDLHKGRQAILITEGAFKADVLATLGIPAINLAGVFGWRGKNDDGGYTALADWEQVNIKGSIFVLAFDSDILTKAEVHQALSRLKRFLESRGAEKVRVLVLPPLLSGKTGIDDFIHETNATPETLARLVVDGLPSAPGESPAEVVGPAPDLAELLVSVRAFIRRFVVVGDAELDTLALWIAHSYALEAADFTPYLHVNSPEKQSGKTRLFEVMKLLARSPWHTSRATVAVLVRKITRDVPTLLLDEVDAAFKGEKEYGEALRAVLDAGVQRGGVASLCVGKGNDLVDFRVFCPKAFAGIGKKLPDTVLDRSIPVNMKRRAPSEKIERLRLRDAKVEASPLQAQLHSWASGAIPMLREARPKLPDGLGDRALDVWEPLLAIADAAGDEWPQRARVAAVALSGNGAGDSESLGVLLLRDVREVFEQQGVEVLFTTELLTGLCAQDERPWGSLRDGKPLDARGLARLLKLYGVAPHNLRRGEEQAKGYARSDLADSWERYTPSPDKLSVPPSPDTRDGTGTDVGTDKPSQGESYLGLVKAPKLWDAGTDKSGRDGVTQGSESLRKAITHRLCGRCGGADFWQRPDGGYVCALCHPDPQKLGRA